MYQLREVNCSHIRFAAVIYGFNSLVPEWPRLLKRHLERGYWWLVGIDWEDPVAFAGMVPMEPFPNIGYLKRAYVLPAHRGHGLQRKLLAVREAKARELGWTLLIS